MSDWLRAYREDISAPDCDMVFDSHSLRARYKEGHDFLQSTCIEKSTPHGFVANRDIENAYRLYGDLLAPNPDYFDVYCTVAFGAALEPMVRDLIFLRGLDFEVVEVSQTYGHEFFAHLRKSTGPIVSPEDNFELRDNLLMQIDRGLGPLGFGAKKAW
ncbi:MAG: hypothetical protein OXC60_16160 [Litoreibacter sp.]|nr:hypothetical protein [Litoreibacter sp.]